MSRILKVKNTNKKEGKIEFENFTVFFIGSRKKSSRKKKKFEVDEDEWRANADRLIQNIQKIKMAARWLPNYDEFSFSLGNLLNTCEQQLNSTPSDRSEFLFFSSFRRVREDTFNSDIEIL